MSDFAILFDIDGVLVDSYEAHFLSWQQLAQAHGRTCTADEFAAGFGRTTREVLLSQWTDRTWTDAELKTLDDEKEALYRKAITQKFPEMPGARELIQQLQDAGWKIALGSSGPVENVTLAVEKLELQPLIGAAISGNDVTYGKPHPEVFLKAAEKLDVEPSRCVVVEDAVHGVEAAHAAGMKCVGFVSRGRTEIELAQADLLIHTLAELNPTVLQDLLMH